MNFLHFLRNEGVDFKGRKLSDIWNFSDIEIENNHDYIQVVFPLNKPSRAVFHGFYLKSDSEVSSIRNDQVSKDNLIKSKTWFLGFLKRNDQWRNYSNHNQLRITRIIECLRLFLLDEEADNFYNEIVSMIGENDKINETTLDFWSKA